MEAKKSRAKEIMEVETIKTLEELVLNSVINKYDLILLARRWAHELKSKEGESRPLQELIPFAVREILTSNVSLKTIHALPLMKGPKKSKETNTAAVLSALRTPEPSAKESKEKASKD